jgi:hypothetical protein
MPRADPQGGQRQHEFLVQGFVTSGAWKLAPIADEAPNESRLDALIKLEVACQLALESLPKLPRETEESLREPIETLCDVTRRELEQLKPGLVKRGAGSS